VLVLVVKSGRHTPYYYSADGIKQAYIRMGSESVPAPDHILSGLKKIVNETKLLPGYTDAMVPVFRSTDDDFSVVLKNVNYGSGGNDGGNGGNLGGNDDSIADLPRAELIIDEIRKNSSVTAKGLAEILEISLRSVERELAELKEQGKIIRVGSSRSGYWEVP